MLKRYRRICVSVLDAAKAISQGLARAVCVWKVNGEAEFYGPKIVIQAKNVYGKFNR